MNVMILQKKLRFISCANIMDWSLFKISLFQECKMVTVWLFNHIFYLLKYSHVAGMAENFCPIRIFSLQPAEKFATNEVRNVVLGW